MTALDRARDLIRTGHADQAIALLESHLAGAREDADAWMLLGDACFHAGRVEAARSAFSHAARLDPGAAQPERARGAMAGMLGDHAGALAAFTRVHALAPDDADALANMGIAHEALGEDAAALECYDRALRREPTAFAALLNRGALLMRHGQAAEAAANNERLVRMHPGNAHAHYNLALAWSLLERPDDSLAALDRTLQLEPEHVGALVDRAVVLATLGRLDEGRAAFADALAVAPDATRARVQAFLASTGHARANWAIGEDGTPDPRVLFLVRGVERLARCDWNGREEFLARFEALVRAGRASGDEVCEWSLPFAVLWLPVADDVRVSTIGAVSRRIAATAARHAGVSRPRASTGRLRIGYVSPDFRPHPGVSVNAPLIAAHDRSCVEVIGYALNALEQSPMAERMRACFDTVRELHGLDDDAALEAIRADGIHVLVDIAGYTDGARPELFAARPAPINVAYMGNVDTTASEWMDYRITDPVATPRSEARRFSEKLVHLPRTFFTYDVSQHVAMPGDRAGHGLPPDGFVFCCFNTAYKLEPVSFGLWMQILRQAPDSVLWLAGDERVARNLRSEALARGVDPVRLVFAAREPDLSRHLARYRLADLFLDTFSYNAHTTAADALHAGLPVLTHPGTTMPSRCAASIVIGAGLAEMVTDTHAQYVETALTLAHDRGALAAVRARLEAARARAPLWNAAGLARAVETAYERMWARHEAGEPPAAFEITG